MRIMPNSILRGAIRDAAWAGGTAAPTFLRPGARIAKKAGAKAARIPGRALRYAGDHPWMAIAPIAAAGFASGLEPRKTMMSTQFGQKSSAILQANLIAGANNHFGTGRDKQTYNAIARQHPYYWGG